MLKKLAKFIRHKLLKISWFRRRIEAYRLARKKKRHHLRWELIMSGQTMRDVETEKPVAHEICVDYTDTRVIGQRPVVPVFIDSVNWGVDK